MLWMDCQLQFTASTRLEHRAAVKKILFTFKGPLTNSICYIRTPNQPSQAATVFFSVAMPSLERRDWLPPTTSLHTYCRSNNYYFNQISTENRPLQLQPTDQSQNQHTAAAQWSAVQPISLPSCHLRVDFLILSKCYITQITSPFDEPFEDYYWK